MKVLTPEQFGHIANKLAKVAQNAGSKDHGIGLKLMDVLIQEGVCECGKSTDKPKEKV